MIIENKAPELNFDLANEEATKALATRIARATRTGDVIVLCGDLGTGKSTFARAFIRTRSNSFEEVPSPTFTMLQTYEASDTIIYHFDLYRIEREEDMFELGVDEAFADGISLIEWGGRLGPLLPTDRLEIHLFVGETENSRHVNLVGYGYWETRLNNEFKQGS